jgi:hypothetical protein
MIDIDDEDSEEKVWDDFQKNGSASISINGEVVTLTELFFYREPDNQIFWAGYVEPRRGRGGGCEDLNIPDKALEAICPGLGIHWNTCEQGHEVGEPIYMGRNKRSQQPYDEAEMKRIEAIFVSKGFRVL